MIATFNIVKSSSEIFKKFDFSIFLKSFTKTLVCDENCWYIGKIEIEKIGDIMKTNR